MNKRNILLLAKTNLNTDGRILNQASEIIKLKGTNIRIALLPDQPTSQDLKLNFEIKELDLSIRNNRRLRFLAVAEWLAKAICQYTTFKPSVVHAHDTSAVLPTAIILLFFPHNSIIIYDDHELPNENEPFTHKLVAFIENTLINNADLTIFANYERKAYLAGKTYVPKRSTVLLNLPTENARLRDMKYASHDTQTIDKLLEGGKTILLHQGRVSEDRGSASLAKLARALPNTHRIVLLGGTKDEHVAFINNNDLDPNSFVIVGTIDYENIDIFWSKCHAAIIFYPPNLINNKLCAPNRLYLAMSKGVPCIVNRDNPVLKKYTDDNPGNYLVEDILSNGFPQIPHNPNSTLETNFNKIASKEGHKISIIYEKAFKYRISSII